MNIVGPDKVAKGKRELYFTFSNTKRGKEINIRSLNADYVIDPTGNIYEFNDTSSPKIVIIGGIDEFAYKKDNEKGVDFFMNEHQYHVVSNIVMFFGVYRKFDGNVYSDNKELNELVKGMFENARG